MIRKYQEKDAPYSFFCEACIGLVDEYNAVVRSARPLQTKPSETHWTRADHYIRGIEFAVSRLREESDEKNKLADRIDRKPNPGIAQHLKIEAVALYSAATALEVLAWELRQPEGAE